MHFLNNLDYTIQALIATLFTWFLTLLGSSVVFLFKKTNKLILDGLLSFAAGVMISASFFSLILPAIEMSENLNITSWIITSLGFILGGLIIYFFDKFFQKNWNKDVNRSMLLIASITLHNIPEGLAVGVAFGSLVCGNSITAAWMLALGIGLQNFPEGSAVSLPLLREGFSKRKAFFYGQLSGIVEPIAGVIGAILVLKMQFLLPFLLSFAAGAMVYVATKELIPESQLNSKKELMTIITLLGFTLMMIMDIALG